MRINAKIFFRYSALQNTGEIEALASSQDLSLRRGVSNFEIQNAIDQLQRSTAAIEKHTETLKTQQELVASLVKENGQHYAARAAADNIQYKAWMTENNHTKSAVRDRSSEGPKRYLIPAGR
jgi:hypothetical protein